MYAVAERLVFVSNITTQKPVAFDTTDYTCISRFVFGASGGHVNENGCETLAHLEHMTESECRAYATDNGLSLYSPFAGSWDSDCANCIRSGDTVAYNEHPDPGCTSSWETVCDEAGDPPADILSCMVLERVVSLAI